MSSIRNFDSPKERRGSYPRLFISRLILSETGYELRFLPSPGSAAVKRLSLHVREKLRGDRIVRFEKPCMDPACGCDDGCVFL